MALAPPPAPAAAAAAAGGAGAPAAAAVDIGAAHQRAAKKHKVVHAANMMVEKATENSVEVAGLIFEVGVDGLLILYGVRVPDTPRGNTLRRIFLSAKFETFLSAVQKEAAPALRGNSREYLAELLADKYDFPADLGERDLWVAPPSKLNKDELVTVLEWLDKHPL